jgi:hypothetical protein
VRRADAKTVRQAVEVIGNVDTPGLLIGKGKAEAFALASKETIINR